MLAGVLLLTTGLASANVSAYALQPAGTFHGDEPIALDGQSWLALRQQDDGSAALVSTRLRVRTVYDSVLDREDEATGRDVGSSVEDALMFLRGTRLRAGSVIGADVDAKELAPSTLPDYTVDLDGQAYRIRTACEPSPQANDDPQEFDCRLLLEHDGRAQPLFAMRGYAPAEGATVLLGDEANAHLIFAGDLDHDGRLDLIFDGSHHYNVSLPTLFLSSEAAPNELVHQVAQYRSVGC